MKTFKSDNERPTRAANSNVTPAPEEKPEVKKKTGMTGTFHAGNARAEKTINPWLSMKTSAQKTADNLNTRCG